VESSDVGPVALCKGVDVKANESRAPYRNSCLFRAHETMQFDVVGCAGIHALS